MSSGAGLHRALGGMRVRQRETSERVAEAIRRYDAASTASELKAVLDWACRYDFWLRTAEEDAAMRAAYERARKRAAAAITAAANVEPSA